MANSHNTDDIHHIAPSQLLSATKTSFFMSESHKNTDAGINKAFFAHLFYG
ncbi:hypothetical protein EDC56_2315 [Sinobacterium caligoides]|uniref:Uncharacterized protein n=1 Tax=Sinobacterium caligoides TaxID=933926 RepID=A0A3N2DPY1_9GAMM|nr:hypothetical protein EDC56_2315 [Sinobacterium caligoides]